MFMTCNSSHWASTRVFVCGSRRRVERRRHASYDISYSSEHASTKQYLTYHDRYDARLLLDALPDVPLPTTASAEEPSSPDGWSDLPSDAEDTFFFSSQEVEDYRREKRRRIISEDRQARLRAIRSEVGDEEKVDADPREEWGGSDEEVLSMPRPNDRFSLLTLPIAVAG